MNQALSDLFVGVVAGLVATFFVVVFSAMWKNAIEPWYEERIYKGVRIEGRWIARCRMGEEEQESIWNIAQTAHKIRVQGTTTLGLNTGKHYEALGEIRNLVLTVTYREISQYTLDRGCVVLKLTRDGREMHGYIVHEDNHQGEIAVTTYILYRDKENQAKKAKNNSAKH